MKSPLLTEDERKRIGLPPLGVLHKLAKDRSDELTRREYPLKIITMTEFRAEPGEYVRATQRHGRSFLITKAGKPVARLLPPSDTTVIEHDGTIRGEMPLTFRRHL
jgi:prevent-host-death family protein